MNVLNIGCDAMAVIKELRWLAAAGECGKAATSYRLVISDDSVKANSLRDYIMDVSVYYTNVVVAMIVE